MKWTPRLNRLSVRFTGFKTPEIDWNEFDLKLEDDYADSGEASQIPISLLATCRTQFGPRAMVACFYGKNGWAYDRSDEVVFVSLDGASDRNRQL